MTPSKAKKLMTGTRAPKAQSEQCETTDMIFREDIKKREKTDVRLCYYLRPCQEKLESEMTHRVQKEESSVKKIKKV